MQNTILTRETAKNIIATYADAWISKNADKVISLFTSDGIYQEYAFRKPYVGHKEIKQYWKDKVINEQSDIHFTLLNLYIDGATIIAEWDAYFFSNKEQKKIHVKEVAILEIANNKIKSLREYWHSEKL